MATVVQGNLASLNECAFDNTSRQRFQSAKDLISDLSKSVLENVRSKDMEYVCSLLFNEKEGLVVFLKQTANNDEFKDSKTLCLEFLLSLSEDARYHVQKHTKIITDVCMSLFMRDRLAKIKTLAMKVMIKVFEIDRGTTEELDFKNLTGKIFLALSGTGGSKLQPTVKAEVYRFLGTMSQFCPVYMMEYSEKLLGIFLADLKQQMTSKTKSPELPIIAGCFHGLVGYLHSFTHSAEEDPRRAAEIFNYAIIAINTKDLKRYEVVRAALNLLAKHIPQMSPFIYDKNKEIYLNLKRWAGEKNSKSIKFALAAMESFFHEMAELLIQKADSNDERAKQYFTFYIKEFHDVISASVTSSELNVAVKGYGAFAAPCRRFLTQSDVQYMFNEMILRSEQIYLLDNSEIQEDKIPYLPSFLECLSSIVFELETVDQTFTRPLERLTVLLIEHFPQISPYQQHYSYCAVFNLMMTMYPKGSIFNLFLKQIIFQGILRTCSHPVMYENENENKSLFEDKDPRKITYRDYLNFWQNLLESTKIKGFKLATMDLEYKEIVSRLIYDEIVSSVLNILRKLDLNAIKTEKSNDENESEGDFSFDPVNGLQPINVKDFHILVNVVDFSKDLLQTRHTARFKKWVYNFGCQIIEMCSRYPVVSGLYKMFALCLKICSSINYFETAKSEDESMDFTMTQSVLIEQEQSVCLVLFSKFIQEVIASLYQYKDDLLASCLQVLLSLPKQLVEIHLPLLMPAIQTALRMGLSYLPLANLTLDALESWCDYVAMDQLKPHLIPILPLLNEYLKSSSYQKFDKRENIVIKPQGSKRGRSTIVVKNHVERIRQGSNYDRWSKAAVSLPRLQQRILILLGSLGSDLSRYLISTDIAEFAVAWDMKKHLKFAVPFADMKPVIYLDLFLPRVIELAKTSTERQTKSAACELLHSLVLFMLGSGAQTPDALQRNYPMDKLYKRIFPVVISLACDVELIAKQLFEPLMLQMIHWFTSNQKYESAETKVLLDALMDGIAHPTDTSLRDFSAKCLKEFVIWSIKQTTPEKLKQSPTSMKSLLKRMYSMALHPSAFQRLGAAFVFNSIYTIFREEESLVDIFVLEILYHFVISLAIAHRDEQNFGTQSQAKVTLDHIERIIRVKANLLNIDQKNRRLPKVFEMGTLECAVLWLLHQCARPQIECSHKCMQLVHKLSSLLPGVSSTANYFKNLLVKNGPTYLTEIFENSLVLSKSPTLSRDNFNFPYTITWLESLLAVADVFAWIFGEKLLIPAEILPNCSHFFDAMNFFITKIALENDVAGNENFVLTPKEINAVNQIKCSIIVRLMNLISILLNHSQDNVKYFQRLPELWNLVTLIVLDPASFGFDITVTDVQKNLPTETQQLLTVLRKNLPAKEMGLFEKALRVQITQCSSSVITDETFILDENRILIQMPQYLTGLVQLFETGFDIANLTAQSNFVSNLSSHLFRVVFASIVTSQDGRLVPVLLNPSINAFANKLLHFSFSFGVSDSLVMSCVLDSTTVFLSSGSGSSTTTHGSLFLSLFCDTLSDHIAAKAELFLPSIINVSVGSHQAVSVTNTVLDRVSKNRSCRKRYGPRLLESLLTLWPRLSNQLKCNNQALLSILSNMFVIDSKTICNEQNQFFETLFDDYLKMIIDMKTSLTFTGRVLDLLPFFTNLSENYASRLKNSLLEMANSIFPLRSTELAVGSPKYNEYIGIFSKILNALELSGSFILLEFIVSIVCRENKHVYEDNLQKCLSIFIKRLPLNKQHEAVQVTYDIFTNESSFTNDIRRNTVERICITLLRNIGIIGLKEFFRKNISHVVDTIQANDIKNSEEKLKTQLVSKIGSFQLIELLYTRLTKDDLNSKSSIVNESFCKGSVQTGKELTQAVTKFALSARRENTQGDNMLIDLRREYHCSACNTLIAVVCCTQNEVKFYTGLLLSENINKGEYLWENIVDSKREYEFEVELKSAFERKRQFVLIRQAAHEKIREQFGGDENPEFASDSVHYLTSQYLSASSLCEEVSQFDFSVSTKALKAGSNEEKVLNYSSKETTTSGASGDYYLELEMDPLNQHECMGSMTALVQHLSTLNSASTDNEMPAWMTPLHTKMCNPSTHHNIKLFLAKLIINNAKIFEPVAKFWISPLMQLIVNGFTGRELNFFNVDLMVVLLDWAVVAIPEDNIIERSLASRILEFAMSHCSHSRRDIFRNNLEIVKTIIELWKPRLDIPFHVIRENLSNPEPTSTFNSVGIQLLGIVLVNGMAPFSSSSSADKDLFLQTLATNISFKYSQVYVAAAEVIGLTMKYLKEKENMSSGSFHDAVCAHVNQLAIKQIDHFVNAIHKLQLHYPPIAMNFTQKVLSVMPKLHGNLKVMCLEIIRSQVENIEGVFIYMKNVHIDSLITHRQENLQVVALGIVDGMLKLLNPSELLFLMPSICAVVTQPNIECRTRAYNILMWIFDNYRNQESGQGLEIKNLAQDGLIQGLADRNEKLKLTINNYWSHETRLSTSTVNRSVSLLNSLYSPIVEQYFLGYASFLLLEMTSRSPDYNRKIFEHPLSDCRFSDYSIDYSWTSRHSSMTPMFTGSLSFQSGSVGSFGGERSLKQIRATQDQLHFTPTQEQGDPSGSAFNWLTQSNAGNPTTHETFGSAYMQSGLLFSKGKSPSKHPSPLNRNYPSLKSDFGDDLLQPTPTPEGENLSQPSQLFRLKRRFFKDQFVLGKIFAKKETQKQIRRQEMDVRRKEQRRSQVTLYRKYRIGDLPDIEINYSALIVPLQALAGKDEKIAKLLFTSLMDGILNEAQNVRDENELEEIFCTLASQFGNIIKKSTQYHSALVAFIMEISFYKAANIRLDYDDVTLACIASSQQHLGINLLEKYLIDDDMNASDYDQPKSKKMRQESLEENENLKLWLKLGELYKSLDNYDVVRGIFSKKFSIRDLTGSALEAESRGDFHSAAKLYEQALNDESNDIDDSEVVFWEDSLLQCYNWLTKWKEIDSFVVRSLSEEPESNKQELCNVWSDTFYQDHYLSYLMRSKLKLIIENRGDDSLLKFVDATLLDSQNSSRRALLESRYSEELALLYIIQHNFDRATHYANNALGNILYNWASSSQCNNLQQFEQLQRLQALSEMKSFLMLINRPGAMNADRVNRVRGVVSTWARKLPHELDSVSVWDDVISNRALYLDVFDEKVDSLPDNLLQDVKFSNKEAYINNATEQNNFVVALKLLDKLHSSVKKEKKSNLIRYYHVYANVHLKRTKAVLVPSDKIRVILNTWTELNKFNKDVQCDINLRITQKKLQSECAERLAQVVENNDNVMGEVDKKYLKMLENHLEKKIRPDQIVSELRNCSYSHRKEIVSISTDTAQTHFELAMFCDKQLRAAEENENANLSSDVIDVYAKTVVESLLNAMKLNHLESINYFPRLLQITEKYPPTLTMFKRKCSQVATWMFVGWVNQMVAILDKPNAESVHNILLNIATDYPQALVYPLKLSTEGYNFDSSTTGKRNKEFVGEIQAMLKITHHIDRFIFALDQLSDFKCVFQDYKQRIEKLLHKGVQKSEAIEEINQMKKRLFTPDETWGKYRSLFAHNCASIIEQIVPETISFKNFVSVCKEISQQIAETSLSHHKKNLALNDYSPWFSNFNSVTSEVEIEIPGQYTGKQKPILQLHVKIAGFGQNVLNLQSIRRPRQITIRGNNERDYRFLVKQGEDLRLDQRIEQLFTLMNDIYNNDSECGSRRLKLSTYQVIPLTTRLGLVEWVEHTNTFRSFLTSAMTQEEIKHIFDQRTGVVATYNKWLALKSGKKVETPGAIYSAVFRNSSDPETSLMYTDLVKKVPHDLLRRAFFNLSSSLESFVVLRNHFATSHAVICISHYLLGIGDRHLANFMIDLHSGVMVGIDFGHAFGTATQFLPVPELIPFRLTPQFLSFMEPLRENGIYTATMSHVLLALRSNAHRLLNIMDVFVKEPSLDWKEFAQKQAEQGAADDVSNESWYPLQKIAFARRKLNGDNPAYIMRDELNLGHSRNPAFARLCEVCLGNRSQQIRSRFPPSGLTVQQQVTSLIDQATDKSILGRTFSGWEPWM